jgi:hypothetical protein
MLGWGKTGAVRAFLTASSARSQDADLYRRYAATLYRQALLTRLDPALAERVVCDVMVNEAALARIPERGEEDARCRLIGPVLRRCQQLAAGAAAVYPRDVAALLHAVMRRPASSSAVVGMRDISLAGRCRGPADEQEEIDANNRIRHDGHHGSRCSGAWAGGGQIAARCAAVPSDEENVVE